MTKSIDTMRDAMSVLFDGIERQGPGDNGFTRTILSSLTDELSSPRIADLECGTGVSSLILAETFGTRVKAVDISAPFLTVLSRAEKQKNLEHLITPINAYMGALDWEAGFIDLIWSEGAAYNLTFRTALKRWRPLLSPDGISVLSEMSWFDNQRPKDAARFWNGAYPEMADETTNCSIAQAVGYEVLRTQRLPVSAWWENYYDPLLA